MTTPAQEEYAQSLAQRYQPPASQHGARELDHSHRCDTGSCGAQAWVRTESRYSTLQLLWCAHHYTKVEHHFSTETHVITDERGHLRAAVRAQANYAVGVG